MAWNLLMGEFWRIQIYFIFFALSVYIPWQLSLLICAWYKPIPDDSFEVHFFKYQRFSRDAVNQYPFTTLTNVIAPCAAFWVKLYDEKLRTISKRLWISKPKWKSVLFLQHIVWSKSSFMCQLCVCRYSVS